MGREFGQPNGSGVDDQRAEDSLSRRKITDRGGSRVVDSGIEKLRKVGPGFVKDAECAEPGIDQIGGRFDNSSEYDGKAEFASDGDDCVKKVLKVIGLEAGFCGIFLHGSDGIGRVLGLVCRQRAPQADCRRANQGLSSR